MVQNKQFFCSNLKPYSNLIRGIDTKINIHYISLYFVANTKQIFGKLRIRTLFYDDIVILPHNYD